MGWVWSGGSNLAPGPLGSVAGDPDRHRGWLLCPQGGGKSPGGGPPPSRLAPPRQRSCLRQDSDAAFGSGKKLLFPYLGAARFLPSPQRMPAADEVVGLSADLPARRRSRPQTQTPLATAAAGTNQRNPQPASDVLHPACTSPFDILSSDAKPKASCER